jgi:hypothetical protein
MVDLLWRLVSGDEFPNDALNKEGRALDAGCEISVGVDPANVFACELSVPATPEARRSEVVNGARSPFENSGLRIIVEEFPQEFDGREFGSRSSGHCTVIIAA